MTRDVKARLLLSVLILAVLVAGACCQEALAQSSPLAAMRQHAPSGLFGWLLNKQALFYRELSGLMRASKRDGTALWTLMGISFAYGVFHAAGPGHGKAVISSYLVANEETWRRGVTLSFASAFLQSLAAIVLVAFAAILIGATAKAMGDTVRVIETLSYALIVLVGARLLWVKGRAFFRTIHTLRSAPASAAEDARHPAACTQHEHEHDHHAAHSHDDADDHLPGTRHDHAHCGHHNHAHEHGDEEGSVLPWGHAHGPEPDELAGPGGWRRGLMAILAVGLRPCSGAILVLVFALAQGLFWAGVASTFVMGVGTAITVAAIATLAVGARTVAKRFAATRAGYGTLALRGLEAGAAVLVTLFGVLLLTGTIASERMGMF